jgi:cbb3-type cytochrome oxidase subunit 3
MDTFLPADTATAAALPPIGVFIRGLFGVFLFMLVFISLIKIMSLYQKRKERNNSKNRDEKRSIRQHF